MTLSEAKAKYPEIVELYSLIDARNLILRALPLSKQFEEVSFREVTLKFNAQTFTIPVDDEFKDADSGNQALLLQLIIYAVEEYEDCEDFLVWSTAYGLNASNPIHLDWYRQLGDVVPKIREIIGKKISGISDFDWQLNAGAAQALRELNS